MNMQMPNRLATVLTLVGYETETVLKSELIGERSELFEAFRKGLGLRVAHFDDVCVMLFRDKQKMHGRLRIEVLYDYHILVLIDFCGRNIPFYDFAKMQLSILCSKNLFHRVVRNAVQIDVRRSDKSDFVVFTVFRINFNVVRRMSAPNSPVLRFKQDVDGHTDLFLR